MSSRNDLFQHEFWNKYAYSVLRNITSIDLKIKHSFMFQTTKPSYVTPRLGLQQGSRLGFRLGLKSRQNFHKKYQNCNDNIFSIDFETENIDIIKLVPIFTAQNVL